MSPDALTTDLDCRAAALAIVDAFHVLTQALVLRGEHNIVTRLSLGLVLTGDTRSKREQVLLSAIEAVLRIMAGRPSKSLNTVLLMGTFGTGKSMLFEALRLAAAMIEYANPDVIMCAAYVFSPRGVLPLAYIAHAMHRRGILTGDDGVLPAWCDPSNHMLAAARQEAFQAWIDAWYRSKGKRVIPLLLIDEFGSMSR